MTYWTFCIRFEYLSGDVELICNTTRAKLGVRASNFNQNINSDGKLINVKVN